MPFISNPPSSLGSSVSSAEIDNDSIVNADINSAAAIAGSKLDLSSVTTMTTTGAVTVGGLLSVTGASGFNLVRSGQTFSVSYSGSSQYDINYTAGELRLFGTAIVLRKPVQVTGTSGEGHIQFTEQASDPAAPSANQVVLFSKDNGSGKTQLMARFNTGAVQQVAIEP